MHNKEFLLLILFFCLMHSSLLSQDPILKQYSINNGLPSQTVYCINQDEQGYLWFGTDAGVSKFDGHVFQNFTIEDGLSDNEILNIHVDSKGRLWFFTLNGSLCYYKNDTFFNARTDARLALAKTKFEAVSFLEDDNGRIWIGSNSSQLFCFDESSGSHLYNLDTLKDPQNSTKNWIFTYSPEPGKILLRLGYHVSRLYEFQNGKFLIYHDQSFLDPISNQFYLKNTGSGSAYYKGKNGICKISGYSNQTLIEVNKIPSYFYDSRFFVDRNQNIWITNLDNKISQFIYTNGSLQSVRKFSLNETIGCVFIDSEGSTWFSTTGKGVYKMPANSEYLTMYGSSQLDGDDNIEFVKSDKSGNVWFSSTNGNLFQIQNQILKKYTLENTQNGHAIKTFEFDNNGNIFCTTREGIFQLINSNSANARFKDLPAKNNGIKYSFRAAKNVKSDRNNKIYFSSATGLLELKGNQGEPYIEYVPFNSLLAHRIYSLYFDLSNNIWFENYSTLCCYDGKKVVTYQIFRDEIPCQISSIAGTEDSILILATYGNGVIFFKNGQVINKLTASEGLTGNLCRNAFIEMDTIYVATTQGFCHFTYTDNYISNLKTYTTSDGLPTNDVKSIYAQLGKIYFATSSGLCVLDKNSGNLPVQIDPPQTHFKSIFVNGVLQKTSRITATYKDDIAIEFSAITFEQPEKLIHQYNLSSNDNSWINTKNRTVILSSIKPGDYDFKLRAKKYNSDWSNPIHIKLQINPPFWQLWWFQGTVMLLFSLLGYYVIRFVTGRKYRLRLQEAKAEQALAEERYRISSDMHDDLGADLSNILLLTRVKKKSQSLQDQSTQQLSEIELFTKILISKVNEIIWALNPIHDSVRNLFDYINDYCKRFIDHDFLKGKIQISYPATNLTVSSAFRRNIFLVVKEALNNIIKHSGATYFELDLRVEESKFLLTISDNGYGFDELKVKSSGNGILNMKKRIIELNGTIELSSIQARGVSLKISVPLPNHN